MTHTDKEQTAQSQEQIINIFNNCKSTEETMLREALSVLKTGCVIYSDVDRRIGELKKRLFWQFGHEAETRGYIAYVDVLKGLLEKEKSNLNITDCPNHN